MQGPASVAGNRTDRSCGGSFSRNPVTSLDQCPLCWLVRIYTFRSTAQGPTREKEANNKAMNELRSPMAVAFFLNPSPSLNFLILCHQPTRCGQREFTSPAGRVSSMKKGTSAHLSPLSSRFLDEISPDSSVARQNRQTTS